MSTCFAGTSDLPQRPTSNIFLNGHRVSALFDTGSSITLARSDLLDKIRTKGTNQSRSPAVKLCGADGKELVSRGCFNISMKVGSRIMSHNILFIDNLQVPCILGMDFMGRHKISIDTSNRTIKYKTGETSTSEKPLLSSHAIHLEPYAETGVSLKVPLQFNQGLIEADDHLPDQVTVMEGITSSTKDKEGGFSCMIVIANFSHLPVRLPAYTPLCKLSIDSKMICTPLAQCLAVNDSTPRILDTAHVDQISLDHIPARWKENYRSLLRSYADVFSKDDLDVGHCTSLPHQVRLKDPNRITSINQYRLPHHLKEVAVDYVQKLLAAGVVRKSNSVFNSPLMLVKKPHADPKKPLSEQYRLVHNYVELNKNIAPCSYPLRHLYELLDDVASGSVFSVLDLSQGFFQQHLIDPHEATSFSIPGMGQFSYCRSPQGMNSSPAYFQRLLDFVLQGISRVYVYIDDVVVSVNSHEENLARLKQIFERFRKHNLKAKPSKCQFGSAKITYLGYDICNASGISPGLAKTEVIKNWPSPTNLKEIRGFIGLTSFFRRAIKDFSILSADLNKLIRKNSGYIKGPLPEKAELSFQQLKKALISKPCLQPVNFDLPFIVTCDASATHYGSCLTQIGADGIERPCGYASKLLSEKEAKQQPGLRERASLVFSLRHWKPYLVGKEFTMRTDHKPNLSIAQGKTNVYDSLSDEIMSYLPFKLQYLNGKEMFVDVLSRPLGHLTAAVQPALSNPPPAMIPSLLARAHDEAGHLSWKYCVEHLKKQYDWPNMIQDVQNYVRSCEICNRANPARPGSLQELKPLSPSATSIGDRIHIDLVDMPRSSDDHVAICTLVDAATGFTVLHAVKTKTSQAVSSTLLERFIPYFGCPKVLVTDKGKENINSEIKFLLNKLNIKHIVSSTGHAQSNGLVERRQQMIINYLRKSSVTYEDQANWPLKLPDLQTVLNSSLSGSRGFSPFFLTFFKHANFPFQQLAESQPNLNDSSSLAARFNLSIKTLKTCQANLDQAFEASKKQFDKRARPSRISPGDLVYVSTSQRGKMHHKFADRFKGPYTCLQELDNDNLYLVPLNEGKPISAHRNNCKLAPVRHAHLRFQNPTPLTTGTPALSQSRSAWDKTFPALLDDDDDGDLVLLDDLNNEAEDDPELHAAVPAFADDTEGNPPTPPPPAALPLPSPNILVTPPPPIPTPAARPDVRLAASSLPNIPAATGARPRTTRAAQPTLLPYVYDELPLEARLAKMFKRKPKKKDRDKQQDKYTTADEDSDLNPDQ